ncbi:hypothetical protein WH47_00081, partial [Habropoda laboriosa]
WEVLSHPPYSPNLFSYHCYLFLSTSNFFAKKHFVHYVKIETAVNSFFASETRYFYIDKMLVER